MHSSNGIAALPLELLHEICSYLVGPLSGLSGSIGLHADEVPEYPPSIAAGDVLHPFYALAASCQELEHAVESFCRRVLRQHSSITKIKLLDADQQSDDGAVKQKKGKSKKKDRKIVHRVLWVKWANKHCAFCGKRSIRRAIFNTLLRCCKKCDDEQWPEKTTMSKALKKYHLTKLDLFRPNPAPINVHVPPIRCATYDCMVRNDATVFLLPDIKRLAEMIHGVDQRARSRRQRGRNSLQAWLDLDYLHGRRRCWIVSTLR